LHWQSRLSWFASDYGGAQRIISIEQRVEEIPASVQQAQEPGGHVRNLSAASVFVAPNSSSHTRFDGSVNVDEICFFVAPIGDEDTEQRERSDMVLNSLLEPSLSQMGLRVIRADQITTPGMITAQTLDFLLHSKLVVADLSFQNPNVFYEVAIRHVIGLPIVHLVRTTDLIPFDAGNFSYDKN
jgi:hypothetical protein